ncbi:MAG TPA: SulP family inorganic anion transporter [Flavobacteriales bacterium]|jgi:MFS superfamily sulfate permease-like transporter|nr:SulP family inorganic anion transporter [Flavobacteriales bacterium]
MRNLFGSIRHDGPASVVVFLVAVPLCLGVALASGAPLMSGLIAGIVGGIVVGALSGSSLGVSGPAAGLAAIVVTSIAELGSFEAFLLTVFLAGAVQILMGVLRAGVIAYYFPSAVIKGMLAGIGVIIILKQLPHAVGYDSDPEGDMVFQQADHQNTFTELVHMLDLISPGAVVIAILCLAVLVLWERPFMKRSKVFGLVPGPLVAVLIGIALGKAGGVFSDLQLSTEHYVQLPDMRGSTLGELFAAPQWSAITDPKVWTIALTIALVASLETLLSVEAIDKLDPHKRVTPTDRELRAQGIGNMASALLGGLPITQVIVRSSANMQAGGRTKLSTMLHGSLILLSLILIPGVLQAIPLAALAAILIQVGFKLAKPKLFAQLWNGGWTQFVPFIVTILGVVFTDLLKGVAMGMAVAAFIILRNNFRVPFHFRGKDHVPGAPILVELSEDVSFLNKASILRMLTELPPGSHIIIDATRSVELDPDVLEILNDETVRAAEKGSVIELRGLSERRRTRVRAVLSRKSVLEALTGERNTATPPVPKEKPSKATTR